MISNNKQYEITLNWISKFEEEIKRVKYADGLDSKMRVILIESMESIVQDLNNEVKDYRIKNNIS